MTKEEILAMKVGQELDALVAEDVMEHEKPNFFPPNALELYLAGDAFHIPGWTCVCIYEEGDTPKWVPDLYSTDILAAWQVVEKLGGAWDIKRRFRPHPDDPPGSPGRPTYQAKVFLSDYDPVEDELIKKHTGRSPWVWSLPEAICKAALLAKLESV